MKVKNFIAARAFIGGILVAFCSASAATAQQAARQPAAGPLDYQIAAILFQQKSAEYRALVFQAYNVARWRLDAELDKKALKRLPKAERRMPPAVIVDIDETILDNSPSNARDVSTGTPFNLNSWYQWGELRKAKPVPGAADFVNYALSKGVKIFYVSNRDEVQRRATLDNLTAVGFRDATDENVLLRQNESTKEPRRQAIAAKYRVLFMIGDNLDDFSAAFERKSVAARFAEVEKARELWGRKFIVLPNAMYGTWESALYDYQRLTEQQKAEIRRNALELP